MNGEEQRDRVIRYIFCSIIRNVTDLYPIFPAARDVDDIETDSHPSNHFTVPEPCCDRFADRNLVGHNSDRISNLVYNLALHPDRHQLEPGARQQLLLDRQIGMRWIEIIDSLIFHNSRYSTFSLSVDQAPSKKTENASGKFLVGLPPCPIRSATLSVQKLLPLTNASTVAFGLALPLDWQTNSATLSTYESAAVSENKAGLLEDSRVARGSNRDSLVRKTRRSK